MYCDLRKLEDSRAHERWLTIPEDDDKWEQYAKENGFIAKSSEGLRRLSSFEYRSLIFFRINNSSTEELFECLILSTIVYCVVSDMKFSH